MTDLLVQKRLRSQFEFDKLELLKLQDQLSTGLRLSRPSDDAPAALRAITLQRLLEQKEQARTNLLTSQSYTGATDNTLDGVSELLTNIRAEALGVIDTTSSPDQRGAVATEVRRAISRLTEVGNQQFRGRYLFAGSSTAVRPFELADDTVVFHGNENSLQTFVDVDYLSETNIDGHQAFGAISADVRGSSDLNPVLTTQTKLSDLRGGLGISKGSFVISDSTSTSTVDIATAETIADVIRLIEANPPAGRQIVVRHSANGLVLDLDDAGGGSISVREVTGGTTAAELGILRTSGGGVSPLVGNDLNPRLLRTRSLDNLLGTRATAVLNSSGLNNDIFLEAVENGAALSDVSIQFVTNNAAGDAALVTFDEGTKTLEIDITPGTTTAVTVVQAINDSGVFLANLDSKLDPNNDGSNVVDVAVSATTSGGAGIVFDRESGIQIAQGNETYSIAFDQAETVEDVLNILNTSAADLLAEISADGRGIDVRSRRSGADLSIGENGGTTASELGIRSFTAETRLNDLNYGRGVDTADGTDFIIQRKDGVELEIDISEALTINDVIERINNHVDNTGDAVQARLAVQGNGIELYDENAAGTETLTVRRAESFAVWDLGFVAKPGDEAPAGSATAATALLQFAPPNEQNTAIQLTASQTGFTLDGVVVELQDGLTGDQASATFDPLAKRLTIQIDASQTTANTVIAAVVANTPFTAGLDATTDPTNDGSGVLGGTGELATTTGGAPELLRGEDANPIEVKGVFNSLLRLNDALTDFDLKAVERAVSMLDDDFRRLTFARSEVGARARDFDALQRRLENEEVDLRASLSLQIDADLVDVISRLSARQANMEATLRLIGQSLQLTVLSFL